MKINRILLVALLGASFLSTAIFARAATSPCCGKPVPIQVVKPICVPEAYQFSTINLEIELDNAGVPQRVEAARWVPYGVRTSIEAAVTMWRFTPLMKNGQAVAGRVILPLTLVPES